MHDLPLLLNIAVALAYALVGGIVATRVGLPSIVGYLIAGVAIGPFTPGFVGSQETIGELAELGVVFLMFGVGIHFSFRDLWRVRSVAIPGATVQMIATTALGYSLARHWGWTPEAGLILGIAVSVASTVVLLRALMDFGVLDSVHGRVAVGWLVLQDLATVAILVLLPLIVGADTGEQSGGMSAVFAVSRAAAFVAFMLLVGTRAVAWLLRRVVRLKSHEMFVLVALTVALGTALAAARWFGVSLALGAFIAGVVVSESPFSHQVHAEMLPFRDTFAVLFFVSVGMLVNPVELVQRWPEVLALSGLVIVGNSLIGAALTLLFGYPVRTALIVGAGLGQIGEFSFIVGQTGMALGRLDSSQYSLILAGAIVSITVNSFLFRPIDRFEHFLEQHPRLWRLLNRQRKTSAPAEEPRRNHVVIVGAGRVGHHLAEILGTLGVPRLVIESDWTRVEALTRDGVPALYGDAARSTILEHAGLAAARALVVTVPDEVVAAIIVAAAREISPALPMTARAGSESGARHLAELGAQSLVRPEFEGGLQILRSTLLTLGFPSRRIQAFTDEIRGREVTGGHVDDEMTLVRKLTAGDLELEWLTVSPASAVAGMTIGETNVRVLSGVTIVAAERDGVVTGNPGPDVELRGGDRVAVIGRADQLAAASILIAFAIAARPGEDEPSS